MEIKNSDFVLDTSPLAQSREALQGWITYTVAGIASVSLSQVDRTMVIEDFFVTPSKRRLGVGTQIFNVLEKGAHVAGFATLALRIDASKQDPAIAVVFAESLGFRAISSSPTHVGLTKPVYSVDHKVPALSKAAALNSEVQSGPLH